MRIARWEVTRSAGTLDRTTIAFAVVLLALGAVAGPAVVSDASLDSGIYRVGVDESSPYYDVVRQHERLVAGSPNAELGEEVSVVVRNGQFRRADTRKGAAAYDELRSAIRTYNDRRMAEQVRRGDASESAAFPVTVSLQYVERVVQQFPGVDGGGDDGSDDSGGDTGSDDSGGDTGSDDSGGDTDSGGAGGGVGGGVSGDGKVRAPSVGTGGGGSDQSGAPGDIAPPFPFQSLVLAFLFIVPMNFVVQAYGSTIVDERVNRRGELLLVAPVTRGDIIAGKTLPYFAGLLAVCGAIAVVVGGDPYSLAAVPPILAAVTPIALLFLAATFVGGMFARSFKELTFVTIAVSVFLTAYVFVPAIFSDVTPIALISPLTLVVRHLRDVGYTAVEYLYSTGPFYLASLALFAVSASVYREEDMFTQKRLAAKALDAVATFVHSKRSVALVTMATLPFVFVAELLFIAVVFPIPAAFALPMLLASIAVVEELAKSVAGYAGFTHGRFADTNLAAVGVGVASGLGFFLAEKATLVVQLVGMGNVEYGRVAFTTVPMDASPLVVVALLFLPLGLHVLTATISALGARRGRTAYALAFALAVLVHLAYNAVVIGIQSGVA
nr:ABC transporter permease subunit [Halorubellus sp. JP-L1]